jgi:predicted aspartyl protease
MIDGFFLEYHTLPAVRIPVLFNEAVSTPDFILDTGFSGDLKVDHIAADDLDIDLRDASVVYIGNANGERVLARLTHGFAELEGKRRPINIIIADGPYLVGISFLATFGYKAIIDCKNWECRLEKADE